MKQIYLDREEQWHELARRATAAGEIGLDTEFSGVNLKKQSCVGRARIHVWSIALRGRAFSSYGFHRCRGWVLSAAALDDAVIRALLENPAVRKNIHNQSVDQHALANHGVRLAGARNTLGLVRWKIPRLINQKGRFGLKPLMNTLLHRDPVCEFEDVVDDVRTVSVTKVKRVTHRYCSCGVDGCRLRKGHTKTAVETDEAITTDKQERFRHPLESIVPGHPRWDLLLRYAADDAVAALEIAEIADATEDPDGWCYTDGARPAFSQAAEDAIVDMETVGIPVDVDYCTASLGPARAQEEEDLAALHEWYVATAPTFGPHRREDADPIWSSHPRKLALFDALRFPRSPIWKKGRVKRGDVKLDGVAQDWIGKNHPPAGWLMTKLLHLQRVRSGIKYLEKLAGSGGMVHPTCGPSSDADERAGAVTGRLGVKGELEAQQLPSIEEKDLYTIRKALTSRGAKTRCWRVALQVHDELVALKAGQPMIVADYSALEVVILADLCLRLFGDDQLARAVAPGAPDIHCVNAREVFGRHLGWTVPTGRGYPNEGQSVLLIPIGDFKKHPFGSLLRGMIKTIFYGLAYRKGAYGFSVLEGADGRMIGEERAQDMLDAFRLAMGCIFTWHDWVSECTRKYHGIYSLGGRWCPLDDEFADGAPEWLNNRGDRRATNFPMQGTGAEIIGDAMVRVRNCPELAAPETGLDRAQELIRHHMCAATANGTRLLIPLSVSIGTGETYWDAK
jgi:DNA polymerase I-like protein with 3'-5' exonuclease and polymerase domains